MKPPKIEIRPLLAGDESNLRKATTIRPFFCFGDNNE